MNDEGKILGIISDIIFLKTNMLHAVGLLVNINGKEVEIPFSSIKVKDDDIVAKLIIEERCRFFIKPSRHIGSEPVSIKVKILPKAMKLLQSREIRQSENALTIMVNINDVLLSKCPICMGKVEPIEEFTFCPSCLTPYHISCINGLLKSVPNEKCWNCGDIHLTRLIQST